jgi:hypothetical protein
MQATFGLVQTLDLLSSNPFRSPGVASVDVAMRIGDRNKMMVFDRVTRRLPQRIEAGSVLALDLEYVRFRRDTVTLPVRVRIPADLRPGNYTLRVMDGRERLALEYQNRPEFRRLDSFEKLVDALQPNFASNHAYIVITENATHPTLQGQALPGLPGSVAAAATSTIRRSDVQGSTTGRIVLEDRISVDGMLLGGASVGFEVVPRRFH